MADLVNFLHSAHVSKIVDNSKNVTPGSLFVAIPGIKSDGHDYIQDAIKSGAVAIVGERDLDLSVPYLKVENSRQALSLLASEFYGNPSKKMKMIGVTGTDGKTTTANLIYEILNASRKKAGLISTVSAKVGGKELDTGFHVTNPEPVELQKFLSLMVENGCEYCVLEVTSHGLDQDRVYGINFEVSVLTNITNEHLDYHKTFENYLMAKSKLFLNSKISILNKDDSSFSEMNKLLDGKTQIKEYSKTSIPKDLIDDVNRRFHETYNVSNCSAAISVAMEFGVESQDIINAIKSFKGVAGRMEEIKNDRGIKIIVDFAHTPNSLENVLLALKTQKQNGAKLISVFGCAGERDSRKRFTMGEISVSISDFVVFTAEDPRNEDVKSIIEEMEKGAKKSGAKINNNYFVIPERGEAISYAINTLAKAGDIVVITGKGHEKSMAYNGVEYPWSDQEAVSYALRNEVKKILR